MGLAGLLVTQAVGCRLGLLVCQWNRVPISAVCFWEGTNKWRLRPPLVLSKCLFLTSRFGSGKVIHVSFQVQSLSLHTYTSPIVHPRRVHVTSRHSARHYIHGLRLRHGAWSLTTLNESCILIHSLWTSSTIPFRVFALTPNLCSSFVGYSVSSLIFTRSYRQEQDKRVTPTT